MKPIVRKLTAALLCAALLLSLPGASASYALGDDLAAGETVLHEGTTLHRGSFYSNTYADLREEAYVDYTPNSRVTPLVTFGGATTALDVHIEQMATHIACLPVAVNINCHVSRHAEVVL